MKFIALTSVNPYISPAIDGLPVPDPRCLINFDRVVYCGAPSTTDPKDVGTLIYSMDRRVFHVKESLDQIAALLNSPSTANPSTQELIQELIREHKEADPGLSLAFLYQGLRFSNFNKILEVSTSVPTCGKPRPYNIPNEQGNPLDYTLILCSPQDYARIQSGELKLPPDWTNPSPISLS